MEGLFEVCFPDFINLKQADGDDQLIVRGPMVVQHIACGDSWHYSIHFSDHTDRANSPQVKGIFL